MLLYEKTMPLNDITDLMTGWRMSWVCMPFHESLSQCLWSSFPGLTLPLADRWTSSGTKSQRKKAKMKRPPKRQSIWISIMPIKQAPKNVEKTLEMKDYTVTCFALTLLVDQRGDKNKSQGGENKRFKNNEGLNRPRNKIRMTLDPFLLKWKCISFSAFFFL